MSEEKFEIKFPKKEEFKEMEHEVEKKCHLIHKDHEEAHKKIHSHHHSHAKHIESWKL